MKIKKKSTKVILTIITVIIVCWLMMFIIDYNKCLNLEKPIFVVPVGTADDSGSGTYQGLGYSVELEAQLNTKSKGLQIISVTMKIFNKVIAASIT